MRRTVLCASLIGIVLATATVAAQSRDQREVRAVVDRLISSLNSVEPAVAYRFMGDLAATAGPFYPPFMSRAESSATIKASLEQMLTELASRSLDATSPIHVRVERKAAWTNFTWRAALSFKDGARHTLEGRTSLVFRKNKKKWQIVHMHSSLPAARPVSQAALQAEGKKISQMERNAWEAVEQNKLDLLANYLATDVSLFGERQAYRTRGKAEALRALQTAAARRELRSWQMLDPQLQLQGNTAVLTYYFSESGVAFGEDFQTNGKKTVVFVKQDGTWRVIHEHRSENR